MLVGQRQLVQVASATALANLVDRVHNLLASVIVDSAAGGWYLLTHPTDEVSERNSRCLVMSLVPNCPFIHVSKLVTWCDDTSEPVSWYVGFPALLKCWQVGKLTCTTTDHRCACWLVSKLKHFFEENLWQLLQITMSTWWNIPWLNFLFFYVWIMDEQLGAILLLKEPINGLRIGHS